MTFDDLYARTVIRRDWHVCGEPLLPLTVGHARILEVLDLWHPLAWIDLMLCAWVCSRPAARFRMPRGPWEKVCWRVRLFRLRRHSFKEHLAAWEAYVGHHREEPVVTWTTTHQSHSSAGTPFMVGLRAALIRTGYRPETVDDVPLDVAIMDIYAGLEGTGQVTVSTRSQEELESAFGQARDYVHALGQN